MADTAALVEKREEFGAKQDRIREVLEAAGKDLDFSRKECLEKLGAMDADDASHKWRALNREAEALGRDLRKEEDRLEAKRFQEREEDRVRPADAAPHPDYDETGRLKSFGERFVGT